MHSNQQLWLSWSRGEIDDATAQTEAERRAASTEARKRAGQGRLPGGFKNAPTSFLRARRAIRSPDRQRSIERRRRLAASGPLPPALAACFTTGELAVLCIVGDEARQHGGCRLHIDAIAARAGVCKTTAQNAIRAARRLRLIAWAERRRAGGPSLTNVIRIISREWQAWLERRGGGFKKMNSTDIRSSKQERFLGITRDPDALKKSWWAIETQISGNAELK